jgi:hypothetical protein
LNFRRQQSLAPRKELRRTVAPGLLIGVDVKRTATRSAFLRRIGLGIVAVAMVSGRYARGGDLVAGGDLGLMHTTAVTGPGAPSLIPVFLGTIGVAVGPFEAGARLGLAHDLLFGRSETLLGPYVGVQTRGSGLTAGLFLEGGLHTLVDIGDGIFTNATSETIDLPFVGARARFGGTIRRQFSAMVSLFVERDLETTAVTVSATECLFDCFTPAVTRYEVGGTMIGASISFAFRKLSPEERARPTNDDEDKPEARPPSEGADSHGQQVERPDMLDRLR